MAEPIRTQLLALLAEATEQSDVQAMAQSTGRSVKSISEALSRLNKEELVEKGDKGFWEIADAGRAEYNRIRDEAAAKEAQEAESKPQEARRASKNLPNHLNKKSRCLHKRTSSGP